MRMCVQDVLVAANEKSQPALSLLQVAFAGGDDYLLDIELFLDLTGAMALGALLPYCGTQVSIVTKPRYPIQSMLYDCLPSTR